MSNRAYWYGHAIGIVRAYPKRKAQLEELKSRTPQTDGIRSKNRISRPTETLALMELPAPQQREYDAVSRAIETTKRLPIGEDILRIIDYIYWKRMGDVIGAAMSLHYSDTTVYRYRRKFLREVARQMGWVE